MSCTKPDPGISPALRDQAGVWASLGLADPQHPKAQLQVPLQHPKTLLHTSTTSQPCSLNQTLWHSKPSQHPNALPQPLWNPKTWLQVLTQHPRTGLHRPPAPQSPARWLPSTPNPGSECPCSTPNLAPGAPTAPGTGLLGPSTQGHGSTPRPCPVPPADPSPNPRSATAPVPPRRLSRAAPRETSRQPLRWAGLC